mmetsp:Transcript_11788/g.15389  ORF Transcript_11788/g.15389 Transcript_11788/m.15389 type:complete len:214 (-) Transcript_11788:256-897(-)
MVSNAILLSYEGTLSQSCCISTITLGERISGRIESACPSFMKKGPSDVIISRNSIALFTSFSFDFLVATSIKIFVRRGPVFPMICPNRLYTTAGRWSKYCFKKSGSYLSGSASPSSSTSTTNISRPSLAVASSFKFDPRRPCIKSFTSSFCSSSALISFICWDIAETDFPISTGSAVDLSFKAPFLSSAIIEILEVLDFETYCTDFKLGVKAC